MSLEKVYLLQVETMVEDVPCTIGIHYYEQTSTPGFVPSQLATAFDTSISAKLLDLLSSNVQLMRIIVRPLVSTGGVPYEANFDDAKMGTGGAEPLAPSIALLIKLRCASTNAKNNGHIYIAGCPENVWINGAWDPTFLGLVTTFCDAIKAPLLGASADTYQACTLSRYLANVKRNPPVTFDVNGYTIGTSISQQRRRQSGRQGIVS